MSKRVPALCAVVATAGLLTMAGTASAQTGGSAPPGEITPTPAPAPAPTSTTPGKAKLLPNGIAVPPANAPPNVVSAIAAGNRIRKAPYVWGGGHRSFTSRGYDCSGAVSYVLNGAGMLASPMPSGPFMKWGLPGPGAWITVYANGGHMYAVIAGLRWDTSAAGFGSGKGPRWRGTLRPTKGYAVRHAPGY